MRKALTITVLMINIGTGFHALLNGSYFVTAACAFFGTLCFIDLKQDV